MAGVAAEAIYLLYFLRRFPLARYYRGDIDIGTITGHTPAGFLQFIAFISALFVIFASAWWLCRGLDDRLSLGIVLGFGAAFGGTLIFTYPITAIDLFAYVDQSLVLVQYHHNPIFTPPSAFTSDPFMSLSDGWRGSVSPYGPLGIVIDAIPTLLVHRNLFVNLILLKTMFTGMGIGEAYIVYSIVRARWPSFALGGAVLVAWNPLFLFEISVNGHNDVAMMLFAMLGIASLADEELTLGPVLLTASVLIKYTTIVLFPLLLIYGASRKSVDERARYLAITLGSCLAMAILAYAPFWQGPDTIAHVLTQGQRFLSSFSSVLSGLVGPGLPLTVATAVGRALFIPVYVYAAWLATHGLSSLMRGCYLVMLGLLLLVVTNFESWYVIWPIVLAASVPSAAVRLSMTVLSFGAALLASFFGFVWVWYGLSGPGFTVADTLSYVVCFVPSVVSLVTFGIVKYFHQAAIQPDGAAGPRAAESRFQ